MALQLRICVDNRAQGFENMLKFSWSGEAILLEMNE
jgi:hypothetical protein